MANLHNAEQVLEQERKHEFNKFQVKIKMTADEIKEAVYEFEFDYASNNSEWLHDLIVEYYKNQKLSDEDYLEMYMENIYVEENDDGTNE
jgi:hypothetical protein